MVLARARRRRPVRRRHERGRRRRGGGRRRVSRRRVVDMQLFSRVLEVDAASRAARIQAGALGPSIESSSPSTASRSAIIRRALSSRPGRWIATRSGGHSRRYHAIDVSSSRFGCSRPGGLSRRAGSRRRARVRARSGRARLGGGARGDHGGVDARAAAAPVPDERERLLPRLHAGAAAARELAQAGLYPSNCRLLGAQEALLNAVSWRTARCSSSASSRRSTRWTRGFTGRSRSPRRSGGAAQRGRRAGTKVSGRGRVGRGVAKGVYQRAVSPERACERGRDRGHVRDGVHVGPLSRAPRGRNGAVEGRCGGCAGGSIMCRFTHV